MSMQTLPDRTHKTGFKDVNQYSNQHKTRALTKAVLPARTRKMTGKMRPNASWNGVIDWSTSDMPVFVYAETTWKSPYLPYAQLSETWTGKEDRTHQAGATTRCSAGGVKSAFHLACDMYGPMMM
jgi:hypothetical protein